MASSPPPGSTDCHAHVFGDPAHYAFSPSRNYTPGRAAVADLRSFLTDLGMERVVVVQPSVYGTDNRCTLDAVSSLHGRARAVVVLEPGISDADLSKLDSRGARGVRLNLHTAGINDTTEAITELETFAGRLRGSGWHLQVFAAHALLTSLQPVLRRLGIPVVLDHFGLVSRGDVPLGTAADAMRRLVAEDGHYVKLSAPQRAVANPEDAPAMEELVRALALKVPERLLWGSDWPHTARKRSAKPGSFEPFEAVDDRRALERVMQWLGSEQISRRMLVDNPVTLYGFGTPG